MIVNCSRTRSDQNIQTSFSPSCYQSSSHFLANEMSFPYLINKNVGDGVIVNNIIVDDDDVVDVVIDY